MGVLRLGCPENAQHLAVAQRDNRGIPASAARGASVFEVHVGNTMPFVCTRMKNPAGALSAKVQTMRVIRIAAHSGAPLLGPAGDDEPPIAGKGMATAKNIGGRQRRRSRLDGAVRHEKAGILDATRGELIGTMLVAAEVEDFAVRQKRRVNGEDF